MKNLHSSSHSDQVERTFLAQVRLYLTLIGRHGIKRWPSGLMRRCWKESERQPGLLVGLIRVGQQSQEGGGSLTLSSTSGIEGVWLACSECDRPRVCSVILSFFFFVFFFIKGAFTYSVFTIGSFEDGHVKTLRRVCPVSGCWSEELLMRKHQCLMLDAT